MFEKKVIILGSGPAGLTAAIYTGRANLEPLVIAGPQPGGQLMLTTEVENYPGFPEGINGPELIAKMRAQALRFGVQIVDEPIESLSFKDHPFKIKAGATEYQAQSVILSTGASTKWLGLPREQELIGHGISSCATCDGFFFKDKDIAVIGGGDSAMEEANFLTKFAKSVTLIHRRDQFRASKIMQDRILGNPKIKVIFDHVVYEILGKTKLTGLKLKNVKTEEIVEISVQGMFVAIGHNPNTEMFKGQIDLDPKNYIKPIDHTRTNIEGVFTAGDVHDHHYRQAVTAAGFGCMAAMDAEKWLEARNP